MRKSKNNGVALLTFFLVVALGFSSASAQQQSPAPADSLDAAAGAGATTSQDLVKAVVDSLSPEVIAQLVKSINPVVTPNNTRLTIVPTARSLAAGTGYVESMMLVLWSVGYGLSDKHAVLAGASLIPDVEMDDQLLYFGTKSSLYKSKSTQLAAGLMSVDQEFLNERLSALYAVATLGNTNAALSLFLAYGFEGSEMAETPLIVVGGERRLGRRTYFVGELPFYDGKMVFPLLGIRRYSEDGGAHWGYTFPYFIYYSFGFGGN